MDITGNTILITGGGSGIGEALALALQAKGNTVIIAGRRLDALEAVAAKAPGIATAQLDIADAAAIAPFAAQIVADHPALNVVIHNAGIMQQEKLLEDFDLDRVEATIATNLLGPIRLTAALLPHLRAQPKATIVTVSSGLAFVPLVLTPTYCATKAAIHSWSQSLRSQLAETNIDVIEIAPPGVATDLMPGHADNPNSMPLQAYIDETMALFEAHPHGPENTVQRVLFLRNAERDGKYAEVYAMLNGSH
ncbi:SDR family oxidoreductase [Sphingomonas immobilis]|uniref:SDR family NAD(P)-dependent oxidoreductase n=1 Tax=Sphingomonas immobilis TaxID=3063997 RepID=A0ABT9A6T3_9SPHN|nr:SDR family NAD(P)-dependent oxidoreductase [Sphingomonas sp. CA1-15]MDO7844477.1 SDR family NAD(P)-dependent oxidoreductase [Sphingomonas sp. CA1-15]